MPSAAIEVRHSYNQAEEIMLINALHLAMVNTFQIKPNDKTVRLVCHEPHRFAYPKNFEKPDRFTPITIDALAGRTLATKRKLYEELVVKLFSLGIPGDHILILLRESPLENWGVRGGQAACDVNLGFQINV